jgi:hypothetical protein
MKLLKFKFTPLQFDSFATVATSTFTVIAKQESEGVERVYKVKSEVVFRINALNAARIGHVNKLTGFQEKLFALPDYTDLKKEFTSTVFKRKVEKILNGVWVDECNEIPAIYEKLKTRDFCTPKLNLFDQIMRDVEKGNFAREWKRCIFTSGMKSGKTDLAERLAKLQKVAGEALALANLAASNSGLSDALKEYAKQQERKAEEAKQKEETEKTLNKLAELLPAASYFRAEKNECGGILAIAEPYKFYAVKNGKRYKVTPKYTFTNCSDVLPTITRLNLESVEDKNVRLYDVTPETANAILSMI